MRSFFRVYSDVESQSWDVETKLGWVVQILGQVKRGNSRTISYFSSTLLPAIHHRKLEFFFNEDRIPVGYVVWASITNDVAERLYKLGRIQLHVSEWNEGDLILIIDVAALDGHLKYLMIELRDHLFARAQMVLYRHRRQTEMPFRTIARGQLCGLLRSHRELDTSCRCGRRDCNWWSAKANPLHS